MGQLCMYIEWACVNLGDKHVRKTINNQQLMFILQVDLIHMKSHFKIQMFY